MDPVNTRKYRNVQGGNTKVALVIGDLVSVARWSPRYLRVYATAELVDRPGRFGHAPYMRITPTIWWSWNLDGRGFSHDREVLPPPHRPPARHRADHRPEKLREHDMTERTDWNSKTIAEFRANEGRVGGPF
jgi:hypothetical protein